ncbi:Phosphatidylinositol-3,4,5-trisphosphate 3-phosphatase and dual-specificity protein phosphatase PTEN [Pelomyxa schiedti]|nr:Phosphatidylinositol-3,4,5-trisphosphate 3-phosphatase and dual-specificity protein phosphatase PTEN [Pelomyxa schiedti]
MSLLKSVRKLVSRDRLRYQANGFDLDLSYITDNILAMSFPSSGVTAVWRNHIDEVVRLLEANHTDRFMIWNLSEIQYDYEKFSNRIFDFPFLDHHAPSIPRLFTILNSLETWLSENSLNVAVVHCKGGKGRTGVVVICWLLYCTEFPDIASAAQHFASRRSATEKGVTQPSQIRYIYYFWNILNGYELISRPVRLRKIRVGPVLPDTEMYFEIYDHTYPEPKLLLNTAETRPYSLFPEDNYITVKISLDVRSDVLIRCYSTATSKEAFHVIFNTAFVSDKYHVETFGVQNLDRSKKHTLPDDFTVAISVGPPKTTFAGEHPAVDKQMEAKIINTYRQRKNLAQAIQQQAPSPHSHTQGSGTPLHPPSSDSPSLDHDNQWALPSFQAPTYPPPPPPPGGHS